MQLHSAAAIARNAMLVWQNAAVANLQVIDLSNNFIESYLESEWPAVSCCVGVFRIEGRGVQLFEKIEGDHFTVLGMPLLPVLGALRDLGELPR
jgi:septum formation protein